MGQAKCQHGECGGSLKRDDDGALICVSCGREHQPPPDDPRTASYRSTPDPTEFFDGPQWRSHNMALLRELSQQVDDVAFWKAYVIAGDVADAVRLHRQNLLEKAREWGIASTKKRHPTTHRMIVCFTVEAADSLARKVAGG